MDPQEIYRYTVDGDPPKVKELTQQALVQGVPPEEIIGKYLIPAMAEVGSLFERKDFFLPEMIAAALAMREALNIVKPLLAGSSDPQIGRVVIGTVRGDMHDIGKNLVSMMMEGAGLEVVDLGVDVSPEQFVAAVKAKEPKVVGLSALLSSTMLEMRATIQALEAAGLRERVKVLVGGAPVTQAFADSIGADGYAPDASSAARRSKELIQFRG
ncbi:MAG: corrinoid protein [Chloroflexi bacterium]|nr:corrinoid protein [Chloroflexota bacterium]